MSSSVLSADAPVTSCVGEFRFASSFLISLRAKMVISRELLLVLCFLSMACPGSSFLRTTGHRPPARTEWRNGCLHVQSRRSSSQRRSRATALAAAGATGGRGTADGVSLCFEPSGVEVICEPGEVALDVALRCDGMPEDSRNPFCHNGGCYNCEVEVVEAAELGIVDNLVRACQYEIPKGTPKLTLIQMNSEEAFEDMI